MTLGDAYEYVRDKMWATYELCATCQYASFPIAGVEMIICNKPVQEECAHNRFMSELEKELNTPVNDLGGEV